MLWTQEKLEIAREILSKYNSLDYAHEKIQNSLGKEITKSSVKCGFRRAGLLSPTRYLRARSANVSAVFDGIAKRAASATASVRATTGGLSRIVVIPDAHHPYHDEKAWRCVLEVIRETQPETVVIIGDFADCMAISSHPKSLDRKLDFAGEVDAVNAALDELQGAATYENGQRARLVYCEGNHEDRITRYLQSKAPELGGLAGLRCRGLFRIGERGIEWVAYRRHIRIGKCSFTHDLGRAGINCARQSLLDFGGNVVVGHSHRAGLAYQGEAKGASHFCLNVGWIGDVNAIDYQHRVRAIRDWQTGLGIVDQDSSGYSWAQFVPIIGGRCVVDGKQIGWRKAA